MGKKKFFAGHAKSTALLTSLLIHVVIVVVALFAVVVSVVQRTEPEFKAPVVSRPKMPLKKLQVPIKTNKKPKPKLRKQIVVKTARTMPELQIPEIRGVKGGTGYGHGNGSGNIVGMDFSLPRLKFLGMEGSGEKIFIILDSTPWIMFDELGGLPGYTVIKEELIRLIKSLDSSVLFSVAVYDHTRAISLFPKMVPASSKNVTALEKWLAPLNVVTGTMRDNEYGTQTLGPGGFEIPEDFIEGSFQGIRTAHWLRPGLFAMHQQADATFVLSGNWGALYDEKPMTKAQWSDRQRARYKQVKTEAHQKLAQENEQRRQEGLPPRVLTDRQLIDHYFPGTQHPPLNIRWYSPTEISKAFIEQRKLSASKETLITRNKKKLREFSLNVIHLIPKTGIPETDPSGTRYEETVKKLNGAYRSLAGLEGIKNATTGSDE